MSAHVGSGAGASPTDDLSEAEEKALNNAINMLALDLLRLNGNDVKAAGAALIESLNGVDDRPARVILLMDGVLNRIRSVMGRQRAATLRGVETNPDVARQAMEGQRRGNRSFALAVKAHCYWDDPLPNSGKPLGDATAADLRDVITYRRKRAAHETRTAAIMQRVLDALLQSGARTVRDGVSNEALKNMYEETP